MPNIDDDDNGDVTVFRLWLSKAYFQGSLWPPKRLINRKASRRLPEFPAYANASVRI
ncbi:hypothetical protein SNOG_15401 [Parastagonospora nodorum SN15]|uniref:Uncharacterized protein n=1 Tax=Phaeosphaeria nodorum (strain SN15 / ATCC MYA-4574 / FGSC 10173) TaxID=321614 RepID=Q0TYX3_PHANO|nr:hypothetical protein SNOG_15401 [Parastagonospora nodorum SN15]EAT77334.1 hypothetical protein SNOG_15401 [Parastagonospora nodorum SN15]